jgi:hypothetical protein
MKIHINNKAQLQDFMIEGVAQFTNEESNVPIGSRAALGGGKQPIRLCE